MSWEDYCRIGLYFVPPAFGKHELADAEGKPQGFATTTGKVELASEILTALGGQRLPRMGEPAHLCSAELVESAERAGGAHLTMITGARKQPYNASMYFNYWAVPRKIALSGGRDERGHGRAARFRCGRLRESCNRQGRSEVYTGNQAHARRSCERRLRMVAPGMGARRTGFRRHMGIERELPHFVLARCGRAAHRHVVVQ